MRFYCSQTAIKEIGITTFQNLKTSKPYVLGFFFMSGMLKVFIYIFFLLFNLIEANILLEYVNEN